MPINVQVLDGNLSFGPTAGFFYSYSSALQALLQLEADGDIAATYPLAGSTIRTSVKQLHYDGTSFWTLEDLPSNLGLVVKRWRLFPFKTFLFPNLVPTELRWQEEMTLINAPNIRWSAQGFAVEHYHRTLDGSALRGSGTVKLSSVAGVNVGDRLYLGPSSFTGFVGNEEHIVVASVNTSTRVVGFTKTGGLENSYISLDPVDFVKSVFIFNDHSFSGVADNRGTLARFGWPSQALALSDVGYNYGNVPAADFDNSTLCWVKNSQIFQLNLNNPNFDVSSSLEANLFEANQNDIITVQDLIADLGANLFYKLQQKETTESVGTGVFTKVDFSPRYNFQTQTLLPVVNSVAISFPSGRFVRRFASGEQLDVRAEVRDQYNVPVLGQTVQFSAALNSLSAAGAVGSFTSPTVITNVSGIADTRYVPSSSTENLLIDIKATVL